MIKRQRHKQVSRHERATYQACTGTEWLTPREIAERGDMAERTARHHATRLTVLGLLNRRYTFPAYSYKVNPKPDKAARAYLETLYL
jgi:DNA-binding CsgD family transcriptional regulator